MPMAIPMERVENRILSIRGHRVMLDADLAELYGVPTKALNQAIKRNAERFPDDFMFQIAREEAEFLRSQTVTLKTVTGTFMEPQNSPGTGTDVASASSRAVMISYPCR